MGLGGRYLGVLSGTFIDTWVQCHAECFITYLWLQSMRKMCIVRFTEVMGKVLSVL